VDAEANAWNKDLARRYCSRIGTNLIFTLQDDAVQNTPRHGKKQDQSMKFEIVAKDGISHLSIEGQLDAVSVSDLRVELDELVGTRPGAVEVDLSRLRMIDSSGVGALVSLYKRVRAQGGNVEIKGIRDQPLAIFQLLKLDRFMLRTDKKSVPPRVSR
jgi:anti-sigma B factor antagonist